MPEIHKKVEMKKISKSKIEVAKKVVNQLKEKYKQAIGSRAPGGPIDACYFKAISQLEGEDLEVGLEGIAELGNLESEPKP